jgi:hypothetical protein
MTDHDWRVHPVDCPARPEGAETCNTAQHRALEGDWSYTKEETDEQAAGGTRP